MDYENLTKKEILELKLKYATGEDTIRELKKELEETDFKENFNSYIKQ